MLVLSDNEKNKNFSVRESIGDFGNDVLLSDDNKDRIVYIMHTGDHFQLITESSQLEYKFNSDLESLDVYKTEEIYYNKSHSLKYVY